MAFKFNPITGTLDLIGGGGPAANGLPVGGVQYDLLVKNSATDYDAIWSRTLDTLTVNGLLTAPDVHGSFNGPVYIYGKNTSGSTIPIATPVYITGSVGASGQVTIAPADADSSTTMPSIGLTRNAVANNGFVDVVVFGVIDLVDTSTYMVNDTLWVSPAGGLTNIRPSGANEVVQVVARVLRVNMASGQILVAGRMSKEDLPNLAAGTVFIGPDRRALTASDISGLAAIATSGSASDLIAGTTAVARGGTGTGSTPTSGQLLIGNGTDYTLATLTAGTNIGITNAAGAITITNTMPVYEWLSDWVSPNNYIGKAPAGSATSASVWTVRKITVSSGGAVTFYGTATPIKWDDRYTAVYT